jgi:hypothetical protein
MTELKKQYTGLIPYKKGRTPWNKDKKILHFANCHPDKKLHAKGLCSTCYDRKYMKPLDKKRNRIKSLYGLEWQDYQNMVEQQGGRCFTCNKVAVLGVDHSHETGQVRRLLCLKCNWILGIVNDDFEILQALINYIKKYT